jgi:hypothetical protein
MIWDYLRAEAWERRLEQEHNEFCSGIETHFAHRLARSASTE